MRKCKLLRLIFTLITVNAGYLSLFSHSTQAEIVRAQDADRFIDSIGIGTHLSRTQSPGKGRFTNPYYTNWKNLDPNNSILSLLKKIGIRHIRGGLKGDIICTPKCRIVSTAEEISQRQLEAYTFAGIKSMIVIDGRETFNIHAPLASSKIPDLLAIIRGAKVGKAHFKEAVEAIEGPNEYDINNENCPDPTPPPTPRCYDPKTWAKTLQEYQGKLYGLVRSDPKLKNKLIIAPASGGRPEIIEQEKIAPIKNYFNKANHHPYPVFWVYPEQEKPEADVGLQRYIEQSKVAWADKPKWITETGYSTAVNSTSGLRRGVTELAQAKYHSRILAYNFSKGIERTYIYQFCDELADKALVNHEAHFGLVTLTDVIPPLPNSPWKLRPKPSYYAIKNLISLLKDPGKPINAGSLDFVILDSKSNTVDSLLLQKRNGHFYLVLWLGIRSTTTSRQGIPPQDVNTVKTIPIKFNQPIRSVKYVIPRAGTFWQPMTVLKNNEIRPSVPDELLILDIEPNRPN
jgi:hypothetical protein